MGGGGVGGRWREWEKKRETGIGVQNEKAVFLKKANLQRKQKKKNFSAASIFLF